MKLNYTLFAVTIFLSGFARGTVSLNFNTEFESGVPSRLSNAGGTATNGMIWGILIDSAGDGFAGSYDFTSPLAAGSKYQFSGSGLGSDDVIWTSINTTADTTGSTEGDGTTKGGIGGFYDLSPVDLTFGSGVAAGDKFYVVWFDGNRGGVLSDPSFVLPSESSTGAFGTPFVGVDPSRSAGKAYLGTGAESTGPGIQVNLVPEPSGVLLGLIGALGLLRRKRN
jgi:hypothetical protein